MLKDPLLLLMPYPRYFYIPDTFMFAICDANGDPHSVTLILLGSLTLKSFPSASSGLLILPCLPSHFLINSVSHFIDNYFACSSLFSNLQHLLPHYSLLILLSTSLGIQKTLKQIIPPIGSTWITRTHPTMSPNLLFDCTHVLCLSSPCG